MSVSTCSSPSWAWGPPAEAPALSAPPLFHVVIGFRAEEGLYTLSFHNCYNLMPGGEQPFNITVSAGVGGSPRTTILPGADT